MDNSCRLHVGKGTVLGPFLRASDTSLKDHQDGFPFSFQGSPPLAVELAPTKTEMESTSHCTGAVDVHRAFLFVFLPVHNSDALTLNTHFIFPGGEGDVTGGTFTFVNCNQN